VGVLVALGGCQRVGVVPGPDGISGWAVVDAAIADDPVKLAELSEQLHNFPTENKPAN
jgi:hypothetical protein